LEQVAPERVRQQSQVNPGKIGFVSNGVVPLLFLLLLSVLVVSRQSAPSPVTAQAAASDFSSGRAMRYLDTIAQAPHPIGSAAHERVREFILNELKTLGVEPQVQVTTGAYSRQGNFIQAARVQNVVARLKGSDNSKAVLLAAHYDSVANSLGASDDGAAVAALLETLRALKSSAPLKNDVIFLFTDGEESGLLGARGFMNQHPWAKDVGLALNFDARGSSGPVMMFETSSGNDWLIREFARSAPRPVTNSLLFEIYRLLPNDTDLTVFKERNVPSLNFAYINTYTSYHSKLDNLTNLDERSLQHQGSYALALARHFGDQQLNVSQAKGNAVYFDIFSATLFRYPIGWVLPLTILIGLCCIAVLVLGFRRGQLRVGGIALGSLAFLLSVAGSALAGMILWWIARLLNNLLGRSLSSSLYYSGLYLAGFAAITVAVCTALYLLFARKTSVENLTAGVLLWMLILLVASSLVAPGASYLLAWPLLFSLAGLAFMIFIRERPSTLMRLAVLTLCAVPTVLLFAPVIYQVFMGLGINLGVVGVILLAIALGLMVPLLSLNSGRRWLLPAGAALVAVGFVVAAIFMTRVDSLHPQANSIQYVLNADTGRAVWASNESSPDEWTRQFFSGVTEKGSLDDFMPTRKGSVYLKGAAPAVSLPTATVNVLDDSTNNDVRTIRLKVSSAHPAMSISTLDDTAGAILASTVNGIRFENKGAQSQKPSWTLRYWSVPEEPLELTLEVKAAQGLKLRFVEQSYELPQIPEMSLKPRPDYMIPTRFTDSDSSFVSKSITFEPRR
jgi:hypothetical protein